ncbi:N-acyl homoserine lactonase family protein [Acuticoccus sp. M5D2P5]|uniref:N-acyl homoserine lactonase family protein n=1 Tax=Acuticoccus kalidii TaxID=2910977 RepID=UPI001F418C08|nr:N-acyl homoserine lactonase family protein [Acuticoccus kalidii]MCF3934565.1 N-acyl homoserine lactonase family protein [Acuticoccus kalidii]
MTDTLPPSPLAAPLHEVYALRYASQPARRRRENFMRHDHHDGPMPTDYFVWIVRNEARTLLVDTGFGERAARERKRKLDHVVPEALARIGIAPEAIDDVILSHLHFDHAGGLDAFPNAAIHLQDAEIAYATGRSMGHGVMRVPFDVEDVVAVVRRIYAERVVFHDGAADPFPGIGLVPLPGHSRGLQGVTVETARGRILLASDGSHFYENFMKMEPFAITIDLAETLATYQRILAIAGRPENVIPGHDPLVRRLFPAIEVGGVTLHALHEAPLTTVADLLDGATT